MTDDNPETAGRSALPSKRFVALLYVPLMVPALLPLYFASQEDDPVLLAIMIGTAIAVLVFNAVVLVAAYRYFERTQGEP